ncbi:hypothetical protein A3J03_00035 [Candidatus Uhrbacteria bacterium RIFCSPLOWO2_02_FULL_46_25]|nr:MAG: hypothetical protein A3J03_00035 [Candidatus Uhrbacteria bacterium RIFCSPLOWO2_02_FULL_46_25]
MHIVKQIVIIIIVAVTVGGAVYLWQDNRSDMNSVSLVLDSSQDELYIVRRDSITKRYHTIVQWPWSSIGFSLEYPETTPWRLMRARVVDYSATDAPRAMEDVKDYLGFIFCPEHYYCDDLRYTGLVFEIVVSNAQYKYRDDPSFLSDDDFSVSDGRIIIAENDKYVYSYRTFIKGCMREGYCRESNPQLNEEMVNRIVELMQSFKVTQ